MASLFLVNLSLYDVNVVYSNKMITLTIYKAFQSPYNLIHYVHIFLQSHSYYS